VKELQLIVFTHSFIQYFAQNNSISVSMQPTMSLFEVLWNMSFATLGKKNSV